MFTVDLEDGVAAIAAAAIKELDDDLHHGSLEAAEEGVREERAVHPYKDHTPSVGLTDSAHVEESPAINGGDMVWPVDYASYVDKGTSRSKAYPFTPIARTRAKERLQFEAQGAVNDFGKRIAR